MKHTFPMSMDEALDLPQEVLINWYRDRRPILDNIATMLHRDLEGFKDQSGSNLLASYSVRVKDEGSFWDKFSNLSKKNRGHLRETYGDSVAPETLVTDLVGARLVFYFSDDLDLAFNYFGVYPAFRVEGVEVYEAINKDSPLYRESHRRIADLARNFEKFRFDHKPTGYESCHLKVRYNRMYVNARIKAAGSHKTQISVEDLEAFPMEIQIRTILQHTWAQTEHRLNYNLVKRTDEVALDSPLFSEEFLCHKSILWAAEHHQRVILQHFKLLHPSSGEGAEIAAEIGDRSRYFDTKERGRLAKINRILHRNSPREVLLELMNFVDDLMKKYRSDKYYILDFSKTTKAWGRQRLILLLFGYLLLAGEESTKREIAELFKGQMRISATNLSAAPIALYEHIRFLDTNFRYKVKSPAERAFFSDPLVAYRTAGAYFAIGNYRRCAHVLDETLTRKFFDGFESSARTSYFLNEKHFLRKLGEYYWRTYITDKRREHVDLRYASDRFALSIASSRGPATRKDFNLENQKAAALAATVFAFRYLEQNPPNLDEFCRNVIPLRKLIDKGQVGKANDRTRSLLWQGRALIEYAEGNRKLAKDFSTRALDSVTRYQRQDKFVNYVSREIYQLVRVNAGIAIKTSPANG